MVVNILICLQLILGSYESQETGNAYAQFDEQYVSFDLINKSAKSIPLWIPGVMNPNLSPYSRSGVSLKIGQKIYFKIKSRKYELLTVDGRLLDTRVDVSALIKERKEEINSGKKKTSTVAL